MRALRALVRSPHARTLDVTDSHDSHEEALDDIARVLVAAPGLERITRIVTARSSSFEILRSRWGRA